ncbi:MAG: LD-carboxypeptidase [Rhodoferax sp.]|jgi:muramoyltetrapeptide carboxypeptidase|uniref:LD-carboxypeptidase n=1 Tax=Rhodoferax sp. TaxID=50421 RepID=UPI001B587676|nr:LD-carboxypeptidase [Rhodoferax sp.]MBP9149681.1 LD-carboxypeptidase [Rhodoferax sp.]MBP9737537.1 LD-carboxypeptidase [Rhodoferax sp.]
MSQHIYIYSPSSAVRDRAAFQRGVKRLRAMGHEVEIDVDALGHHQRFAGDDDVRLQSIHRAAASGADLALTSRGGYGLSRILPDIRYKKIAKAIERGTQFVGYSDFTALQSALVAKTGAISWAGPSLCDGFGVETGTEPDEIMQACFDDLLCGQGEGTGWRQNKLGTKKLLADPNAKVLAEDGILWGGNLTVLTSLLGTPFFPKIKRGILFLEDVGEHPYRIERCLTQLLHAGVLDRQKAVLMGQFTGYQLGANDRGYTLQSAIDWLRQKIKVPVLTNLPFGHVQTRVLLPVGAVCDLHVEGRDALLTWGHLSPDGLN